MATHGKPDFETQLKPLGKKRRDISYINLNTLEVECTYNQCYKKFKAGQEETTWYPRKYSPEGALGVIFTTYFHKCSECGRKEQNMADKNCSIWTYHNAVSGQSDIPRHGYVIDTNADLGPDVYPDIVEPII